MDCFAKSRNKSAKAAIKREKEVEEHHSLFFRGMHPPGRVDVGNDNPRPAKWDNMVFVEHPSDLASYQQFRSIRYDGLLPDDGKGNKGGRYRELHINVKNKNLPHQHLWLEIYKLPANIKYVYLNFPKRNPAKEDCQFCAIAGLRSRRWSPFLTPEDAYAFWAYSDPAGTPPTTSSAPSSANTSLVQHDSADSDPHQPHTLSPPHDVIIISSDEESPERAASTILKPLPKPTGRTSQSTEGGDESSGSLRPGSSSGSNRTHSSMEHSSCEDPRKAGAGATSKDPNTTGSGSSKVVSFLKDKTKDETISRGPEDVTMDITSEDDTTQSEMNTAFVDVTNPLVFPYNLRPRGNL